MRNRIGIVGGGQLARMLTFEAKKMGFCVTVLDPTPNSPAGQVADLQITAKLTDKHAMEKLASVSDVITFDWEHADPDLLEELEQAGTIIHPSPKTLKLIRDKYEQKKLLKKVGIPVGEFAAVSKRDEILQVAKKFGYPLLLKTRVGGYDGKGNALIKNEKTINDALEKLKGEKLYIEQYIPFVKELAIMVSRSTRGDIAFFPVVETLHKNNILHQVFAPAPIKSSLQKKIEAVAKKIMKQLVGAGVFGIELFYTKNGEIFVNELAPRVHNSGHYTIEFCKTSQFEQHIRAITGLPLGKTGTKAKAAVMINILGDRTGYAEVTGLEKALLVSDVSVHIYGKRTTKPERKMGHLTAVGKNHSIALRNAEKAKKHLSI